jgi:hypothetical protein
MPTYEFFDTEKNEKFEMFMKISEKDKFLMDNPHIQPMISAVSIVGGVSIKDKVPDGFKEVLSKVAEKHPSSLVGDRYGRKTAKESKTKQLVDAHVKKITKRLTK